MKTRYCTSNKSRETLKNVATSMKPTEKKKEVDFKMHVIKSPRLAIVESSHYLKAKWGHRTSCTHRFMVSIS